MSEFSYRSFKVPGLGKIGRVSFVFKETGESVEYMDAGQHAPRELYEKALVYLRGRKRG